MWEVFFETFLFLTVASMLGAAIGFVLSNIISSSKIEFLEEENWQLKEDLRKFRGNFFQLENDLKAAKSNAPEQNTPKFKAAKNAKHEQEIESLKTEIALLKEDAKRAKFDLNSFDELKERYDDLLREREALFQKLDNLETPSPPIVEEAKKVVSSMNAAKLAPDIIRPMASPRTTSRIEEALDRSSPAKKSTSEGKDELDQLYSQQPVYMEAIYLEEIKMKALNFDYSKIGTRKIGSSDKLQAIEGIGALIEKKLKAIDINSYAQLSKLDENTIVELGDIIGCSSDQIKRESWKAQATKLLKQDV